MAPRKSIVVLGGGVIGLTTAAVLSQAHDVKIIASKFGPDTESVKATAIWHVYLVPETEIVLSWAETTLKKLIDIHAQYPQAGIELIDGVELFRKQSKNVPVWSTIPPRFEMLSEAEISEYSRHEHLAIGSTILTLCNEWPVKWGYRIRAPVAKMTTYLNWLMNLIVESGVKLERGTVADPADTALSCDCVINCTGLGAR
jgi:D-amino-acid oxidase